MSSRRLGRRSDLSRTYEDGEHITREGEVSNEMYVVQEGVVRIVRHAPEGPVALGEVHQGDFFGEMSLLESLPRVADAIAVGPVRVLVIDRGTLLLRLRRDPTLALEMMQRLSSRLRERSEQPLP